MEKKEIIKSILKDLSKGLSEEEAKKILMEKVGNIKSEEIFEIEQELIKEGLSVDEIKKFCNVHALLFEGMLEKKISSDQSPSHPLNLLKEENKEIAKIVDEIIRKNEEKDLEGLKILLEKLLNIEKHFQKKELVLFPILERKGFYGPSKVMWSKDDEIRILIKKSLENLKAHEEPSYNEILKSMVDEVSSMIYKEENILFPTVLEKFSLEDWVNVFKEFSKIGYCFIGEPLEVFELKDLRKMVQKEPEYKEKEVVFKTGKLSLKEIDAIFNTLPVDISYIDKNDIVKYFSDNDNRIFLRTESVLGREVRNCHPPRSIEAVEKVIDDLKNGRKASHDFWINFKGRFILIRYFPVKDRSGEFLGILEVTQDITDIKKLEGEKRLVD